MHATPRCAIYEKKEEQNVCNLCCQPQEKLTLDHVPPRGTFSEALTLTSRRRGMQVKSLFASEGDRWVLSQNGIRFRTLCSKCNNDRLGRDFDPSLVKLSRDARRMLQQRRHVSSWVQCEPDKVLRAVFGHLLAAKNYTPRTIIDEKMRAFVLDKTASQPQDLYVYYWAQPDHSVRVVRDTSFMEPNGRLTYCSAMVWYPLGFKICAAEGFRDELDLMNSHLGTNATRMPLRPRAPGSFDAWFNNTIKATGASALTAFQALDQRR